MANHIRKRTVLILFCMVIVWSIQSGCKTATSTREGVARNEEPIREEAAADNGETPHVIWEVPTPLGQPEYFLRFMDGSIIRRRFLSPADGGLLKGAIYLSEMSPGGQHIDTASRDIIIRLCSDAEGGLGNISDTEICSTVITTPERPRQSDPFIIQVEFSLACQIEKGEHYWLVLEPGWRERPSFREGEQKTYIDLLTEGETRSDAVMRTEWQPGFDGGELGDENSRPCLCDLSVYSKGRED